MACLIEISGNERRRFELSDLVRIGREAGSAVPLSDARVSRRHCEITRLEGGRYRLRDLGSTGGTFVDGRRITEVNLVDGAEIVLGDTRLRFEEHAPRSYTLNEITIEADDTERLDVACAADLPAVDPSFPSSSQVMELDKLRRCYDQLRVAFELSRAIGVEHELEPLLKRIVDTVLQVLHADRAAIVLYDPTTGRATHTAARTREKTRERWQLARAIVAHVLSHRAAVLEPRAPRTHDGWTVLCAPLLYRGEVLGIIYADARGDEVTFQERDIELLTALANQSALAVKNTLLRERIDAFAAEERRRLERIVGDIPVGIALLDGAHRVAFANARARELLGLLAAPTGDSPIECLGTIPLEELLAREESSPLEAEVPGPTPRIIRLWAARSEGSDGRAETVLTLGDVTLERKREEHATRADRIALAGQVAGGIAHDFNNLLTVILSYTDGAQLDPASAATTEALAEIHRAASTGASLTRQLLSLSRSEATRPEPLDLNETIQNLAGILKRSLGEGIEIELRLGDLLSPTTIDRTQMEQVLLNLAVNARDAMPKGGCFVLETRRIEISEAADVAKFGVKPGPYLHLSARDNGCGMPPDVRTRAFEPYFTTKPIGRGTGLGLATTHRIITHAGGNVTVDSREGAGTTFHVLLPVRITQAPLRLVARARQTENPGRGRRVLVVEDQPAVRRVVGGALRRSGFLVLEAANGNEALEITTLTPVDLVVSDVMMPGLCGTDLARRLRERWPNLPIVLATGHAGDLLVGFDLPGVQLLNKPFSHPELVCAALAAFDSTVSRTQTTDAAPARQHLHEVR
jgi:signal transduction histidine kinase/ActR/RegA family two-component response regulator